MPRRRRIEPGELRNSFIFSVTAIEDIKQKVTVEGDRLNLVDSDRTLFDVSGLDRIGIIELASAAGQVNG